MIKYHVWLNSWIHDKPEYDEYARLGLGEIRRMYLQPHVHYVILWFSGFQIWAVLALQSFPSERNEFAIMVEVVPIILT